MKNLDAHDSLELWSALIDWNLFEVSLLYCKYFIYDAVTKDASTLFTAD